MPRSFITVARAEALTRTFGTAIELATVHLQAASMRTRAWETARAS